jgi:carotenoid cleavage dioxygenase
MLFFGYSIIAPFLRYGVVDAQGRLDRWFEVDSPFGSMMHDFIVTSEHVVFPVFPNTFSPENFAKTGSPLAWEPERGTHLGVMPRDGGPDDVIWLQTDPCHVFHFVNAHSEASRVVVELCRFDSLPLFGDGPGPPELWRWEIDTASGSVKKERYDDARADFPRIDDRRAGLPHRHSWYAAVMSGRSSIGEGPGFDCISHIDAETGRRRDLQLPAGDIAGEPIFVPRSADAPEGDGFVLFLAWRRAEDRSDLLILEAQSIDAAPLATVRLPHRVPAGFHGGWKPA